MKFLVLFFHVCLAQHFRTYELCPLYSQNDDNSAYISLIQDSPCLNVLPKNFRTTQDKIHESDTFKKVLQKDHEIFMPDLTGLKDLSVIASGQFSIEEFRNVLKKRKNSSTLIVLDLRKESHLFLNGLPVSWHCPKNWILMHKSDQESEFEELKLFEFLKNQEFVEMFQRTKEKLHDPSLVSVKSVKTEKQLCDEESVVYRRFPILDRQRPTDHTVQKLLDLFYEFPINLNLNEFWVHCKGGAGRTTSVMVMLDSFYNSSVVSFENIVRRQYLLGRSNLGDLKRYENLFNYQYAKERLEFLYEFYEFTKIKSKNWLAHRNKCIHRNFQGLEFI